MPERRRKQIAALISILVYAGIFLVSSLPASALPANIPDIIPHAIEYAFLAFFFIGIFSDPPSLRSIAAVFAALLLLALLDEFHQSFVPGRFCTLEDVLFDAIGCGFGLLAYLGLRSWSTRSRGGRWARCLAANWFRS